MRIRTSLYQSLSPDQEDRIEKQLAGRTAKLKGERLHPHAHQDFKDGYAQAGRPLTSQQVKYLQS